MKGLSKIAVIGVTAALGVTPVALAAGNPNHPAGPPANQGTAHKPTNPGSQGTTSTHPGPTASLPAQAKAYGRYCQGESKKHVSGQKGTPFSQCVTAMAKLATGKVTSPKTACSTESKKHVAGQKGTPFSQCVSGAAKLLKTQGSDTGSSTGS